MVDIHDLEPDRCDQENVWLQDPGTHKDQLEVRHYVTVHGMAAAIQ